MAKNGSGFGMLGYWMLLYVALVPCAFYATYFSVIDQPKPSIVHIHFTVMVIWLAISVAQPLLIRYGRYPAHRQIGRLSFVLLPLVVLTGYAMLRMGTLDYMASVAKQHGQSQETVWREGARYASLGTWYVLWPAIFYSLGIINRKKMIPHSRYMLATVLTVSGPIIDRVFFNVLRIESIGPLPAEWVAFLVVDLTLLALLIMDYRKGRSIKPLLVSLMTYLAGQLLFVSFMKSGEWVPIARVILQMG